MNISPRVDSLTTFHVMEILARARELEAEGRDIIHMEIGEPDFGTPSAITLAALEVLKADPIKYTPASGLPELKTAISEFYQQRYEVSVDTKRIFITPGASGGFLLSLGLLVTAEAEVLLADPGYPCYPNFVRLFGGKPQHIPVDESSGFHIQPNHVDQFWTTQTQGLIFASPSNPTGMVMKPLEMEALILAVMKREGFIISDEIYHGLSYGVSTRTALEFSQEVFVVNSFSKYFGMTGWRLGWVIVPEAYVEMSERLAQNIFISAPTLSQKAALAAFSGSNIDELEQRRRAFEERRDFLVGGLKTLGFKLSCQPEGAFYVYADCSDLTDSSQALASELLERAGVAVTPGIDFGESHVERYLRFCYTAPIERISEGLQRIERYLRLAT